jgi:hypothetical protein
MCPDRIRSSAATGGRSIARRFFSCAVLIAACLGAEVQARQTAPQVNVREERGTFILAARFEVSEPLDIVRQVLTDYERIPRFMPEVRKSTVVERTIERVVVEQEVDARMFVFSKRIHLLLEIREDGSTLRFRDTCGRNFSRYEGAWSIDATGPRTVVTYELVAKPTFSIPDFLLKRLLRRDADRLITALKTEMSSRTETKP